MSRGNYMYPQLLYPTSCRMYRCNICQNMRNRLCMHAWAGGIPNDNQPQLRSATFDMTLFLENVMMNDERMKKKTYMYICVYITCETRTGKCFMELGQIDERCRQLRRQEGALVHSQFTTPLLSSQPQCLSFTPSISNTAHHFSTPKDGNSWPLGTKGDVGGTLARSKSIFVCRNVYIYIQRPVYLIPFSR